MSIAGANRPACLAQAKPRSTAGRRRKDAAFLGVCVVTAGLSVVVLLVLLGAIVTQGAKRCDWSFLVSPPNPDAKLAGIYPALWGSVWVCAVCALCALPLGVATAIFLEEYKPKRRLLRLAHSVVQLNISNLAGVPSVVYGVLGLTVFVSMFGKTEGYGAAPWEIGVEYYNQFLSEGDRVLLTPAASYNAPRRASPKAWLPRPPPGGRSPSM